MLDEIEGMEKATRYTMVSSLSGAWEITKFRKEIRLLKEEGAGDLPKRGMRLKLSAPEARKPRDREQELVDRWGVRGGGSCNKEGKKRLNSEVASPPKVPRGNAAGLTNVKK